jgi:hypothetical protein
VLAKLPKQSPCDLEAALVTAAHLTRVRIENLRWVPKEKGYRFVLRPRYATEYQGTHTLEGERPPYQRLNHRLDRTVCAVCWHGHRDFFRAAYRFCDDIIFSSALATYGCSDDFERAYPATGYKNIGSQMEPCQISDACYCEE